MIVDAATAARRAFEGAFDACVIGTGPAGITLARALAAQGHRVALMEAGGLEWSAESQAVYEGEIVGLEVPLPLDASRLRYFGGTSNHWNGLIRALTPEDFRPRPHNPLSGWPISHEDLAPYTEETNRILDARPEHTTPPPPGAGPGDAFQAVDFLRSPPTRFGEKYHDEIAAAPAIVLGLHANLVDLRLDETLAHVTEAHFRSYEPGDPGFAVRARVFCLCAGGIENARLLLNFRSQMPTGIGNAHDLVGRYFCDHPSLRIGSFLFEAPPAAPSQFFALSEAFIAENQVLGVGIRVNHMPQRRLSLVTETLREVQCAPFINRLAAAVLGERAARCDAGGLMDYWRSRDPERYPQGSVGINLEQALNPDSRVLLGEERDAFGLARPRLDWRLTELDHRSFRVGALAFAEFAAATGLGRMRIYDWLLVDEPPLPDYMRLSYLSNLSSWHHMGTTRMSESPRTGVVDADCRVHGVENLYLGGSSVFASPGYANPTYTIVQLALRLGDHLGSRLRETDRAG